MAENGAKAVKKRFWGFIMYPESAPPNWQEILAETGLEGAVSPLHDKDLASETEDESKKSHWHVMLCWPGPTTYDVALQITQMVNATIPKPVQSVRGYYRYFTHMDSPEKHQYDAIEIIHLGGFDPMDHASASDRYKILGEIFEIIRQKQIIDYAFLVYYLYDEGLTEHWQVAVTSTTVIAEVLKSLRCSIR